MKNKSYAVIGLGQFGMTVALTLAEANCDVLAIDDKDDNVQDIAEKVSYAVKADVRDPGILESLGVQNVDVAVIAVAENGVPPHLPVVEVKQKQVHTDRCEQRKQDILEEYHREHTAPQDTQMRAALRTRKGDPQNAEHVIHTTQCDAEDRGVHKQHEL